MSIHWIDLFILVVFLLGIWIQWDRGVLYLVADIFAWMAGLWLGFKSASMWAKELAWQTILSYELAIMVVFFLVVVFSVYVLRRMLMSIAERTEQQYLYGMWQALLGSGLAMIYTGLLVFFCAHLLMQMVFADSLMVALSQSWFFQTMYVEMRSWLS